MDEDERDGVIQNDGIRGNPNPTIISESGLYSLILTKPVRTITREGDPWFVLVAVCKVLEIANPSNVSHRLDDEEKATLIWSEGRAGHGPQSYAIIGESGLYSLMMVSRKRDKKRLKNR